MTLLAFLHFDRGGFEFVERAAVQVQLIDGVHAISNHLSRKYLRAPRSDRDRESAPPRVAARRARSTDILNTATARATTTLMLVIPLVPGLWSVPRAITAPASIRSFTGGSLPIESAVPGASVATTPARASAMASPRFARRR